MLRSMYSGISGMKVNQTKLDVIGNNISNVNTTGFKSSRARFSDSLCQNVSNATAPTTSTGGINASQVGLGVQLASIDSVMTQGSMQTTNRALDVAIDGNGYFIVSSGPTIYGDGTLGVSHQDGNHGINNTSLSASGATLMYTRDGSFIRDTDGNLLTGDGYRVMGYSLTNDDASQTATEQPSSAVEIGTLKFSFGPGSQLNGYKITLGKIAAGTVTSVDIDKSNQEIVINGDFSETSTLTSDAITNTMSNALSAAGIGQKITSTGNIPTFKDLTTEKIAGGSDATSPDSIYLAGFTVKLPKTSALNGFQFEIGKVNQDPASVTINQSSKKITVDADFISSPAVSSSALRSAFEDALGRLTDPELEDTTTIVSGTASNLSNIENISGTAVPAVAPTLTGTDLMGFNLAVQGYASGDNVKGNDLNGYTFKVAPSSSAIGVSVNTSDKIITITGKVEVDSTLTDPTAIQTARDQIVTDINTALHNKLTSSAYNLKDSFVKVTGGHYVSTSTDTSVKVNTDGVDEAAAKGITIGAEPGFTLKFPTAAELIDAYSAAHPGASDAELAEAGKKCDGLTFKITNVKSEDGLLTVTKTGNVVEIQGDFVNSNKVTKADLQEKINGVLGLDNTSDTKVKVTGQTNGYSDLICTDVVSGGEDLQPAGGVSAMGLDFTFSDGSAFNGYKIQIGKINAQQTTADIDKDNKVITVNADFVNGTSKDMIQNALNKAIKNSSLTGNSITVTESNSGLINFSGRTESGITSGGTPVQSIKEDGTVNFVNGAGKTYAYDSSLKSLKIPDAVTDPATGKAVKVVGYTIGSNGVITCTLEDNTMAAIGQIAMADFNNPEGLTKMGGNLYTESVNSGTATIKSGVNTLGESNEKAFGANRQNMLEMSNVDLAEQFTDMIVATRAFQASGKMISTGDEVLTEIINLKR